MKHRIRIARGNKSISTNTAEVGQPIYDTTSKYLYIGKNNTTQLKDYTNEDAVKAYTADRLNHNINVTITDNDSTNEYINTNINWASNTTLTLPSRIKANIVGNINGDVTGNVLGDLDGNAAYAYKANYDIVISTQVEFDALINSSTWLGAKSVLFNGKNGPFTTSTNGIKIPDTVFNIEGINDATIGVAFFTYDFNNSKAALYYNTLHVESDNIYSIKNINLQYAGLGNNSHGFYNMSNMSNCKCYFDSSTMVSISGVVDGFYSCYRLINCESINNNENRAWGSGFYECDYLINCKGYGVWEGFGRCHNLTNCKGSGKYYGFWTCDNLTNCEGEGRATTSSSSYGYYNCNFLTNCIGTGKGLTLGCGFYGCISISCCLSTGNITGTNSYGYYDCSYGSCNQVWGNVTASTGGTMTKWSTETNE